MEDVYWGILEEVQINIPIASQGEILEYSIENAKSYERVLQVYLQPSM